MPELMGGLCGDHSCCDGDCTHEERGRVKVCQPWGQHLGVIVLWLQEPGYCLLQAAEGGSCCCMGVKRIARHCKEWMAGVQDMQVSSTLTLGHPAPGVLEQLCCSAARQTLGL